MPDRVAVLLLAAGSGSRVGHPVNKVLLPLHGVPVLVWSLRDALEIPSAAGVVVVVRAGEEAAVREVLDRYVPGAQVEIVTGGLTRHESEWRGLRTLAPEIEAGRIGIVAVHDAARPLAGPELFARVVDAAGTHGGALPVVPLGPVILHDGGPAPDGIAGVQTPQAFRAAALLAAYSRAAADGFEGTDTASCLERYGELRIAAVPGHADNLKITFAEDFRAAEQLTAR